MRAAITIIVLFNIAVIAAVGYVAVHFLGKLW